MLEQKCATAVRITATADDLADEGLCERFISLAGNTPGIADLMAGKVSKRGLNLIYIGISLTIRCEPGNFTIVGEGYATPV